MHLKVRMLRTEHSLPDVQVYMRNNRGDADAIQSFLQVVDSQII